MKTGKEQAPNTKARPDPQLRKLAKVPEHLIDTRDIPEVTDWSRAQRGKFFARDE